MGIKFIIIKFETFDLFIKPFYNVSRVYSFLFRDTPTFWQITDLSYMYRHNQAGLNRMNTFVSKVI